MRKVVQSLCGLAVFAAFFFSWLWTLTFVNRVMIYRDREKYRPEIYLVTGSVYYRDDESGDSWWLTGTIASRFLRMDGYPALGFTLIELLMVIAIIALLAALSLPALARAKDSWHVGCVPPAKWPGLL